MVAKSLDGLSTGLWNGAVMATYIYLIEDNSNKVRALACCYAIVYLLYSTPLRLRGICCSVLRPSCCHLFVHAALNTIALPACNGSLR